MRFPLYCILLFVTNTLFSQSGSTLTNKEYLELQNKAKALMSADVDSSFIVCNRIEKSNSYTHKAFAAGAKSYLFQIKGDTIRSNQFYKLAFEDFKKLTVSTEKTQLNACLLSFGGLIDWKRGHFAKALDKFHEGIILSEKIKDQLQILKFNNNIALINAEVGNYNLAISATRQSDKILDITSNLYEKYIFTVNKSNIYLNLGRFYERYYIENTNKKILLDSSLFFYKKAIAYSKDFNRIKAQMSLGNIYYFEKNYLEAEKIYQNILIEVKQNDFKNEQSTALYNLGVLYFTVEKYDKALVYFKNVDSIYALYKVNHSDYTISNYCQAKIYEAYKDSDKALKHSKIYLDNFELDESKLNKETTEVNFRLGKMNLTKEMEGVQDEFKKKDLIEKILVAFFAILILVLVVFLVKSSREKKQNKEKINALIQEFTGSIEKKDKELNDLLSRNNSTQEGNIDQSKKIGLAISIDEEKENEIIEKLLTLEKKEYYLSPDFTLQKVAKKIKTNTTYLSYVVNKRFGKTFSEYSNELKINYVINELIRNPTYRKYSTQAIGESVGFKNAVSFTKSFNKRAGITPAQFIKGFSEKIND
ncbi:MAG: AraC family transcriptional regulator [Flavobacterium sp.]